MLPAVVVPHVDDQPLALEHRIIIPRPLGVVLGPHGPEVHVADRALPLLLDAAAPLVLPVVVAEVPLLPGPDGNHDDLATRGLLFLGRLLRLDLEEHLAPGLVAKERRDVDHGERRHPVQRLDDVAHLDAGPVAAER